MCNANWHDYKIPTALDVPAEQKVHSVDLVDTEYYLRARRVPKHRLTQKLDHPEIWNALQLLHARPVGPWAGEGFAVEGDDTDAAQ